MKYLSYHSLKVNSQFELAFNAGPLNKLMHNIQPKGSISRAHQKYCFLIIYGSFIGVVNIDHVHKIVDCPRLNSSSQMLPRQLWLGEKN